MSFVKSITLSIEANHTLLLTGPAQVKLKKGNVESFGAQIGLDDWTEVEEFRQQPLLARDPSTLDVKPSFGSSWKEVNASTIPMGWDEAADALKQQRGVTVIVGELDAGKSSLCTFLANRCLQSGMKVGLVDGDVGQADVGPPATVSSSNIAEPIIGLHQAKSRTSFFIGETSPSNVSSKLIRMLVRLKRELVNSSDAVLVNTDGWIGDSGALQFKQELLHETDPDLVIGLARQDETDPVLDLANCPSLRVSVSLHAKVRSRDERKKSREAGYRRFLIGSKPIKISSQDTTLRMFDHPEQSNLQGDRRFRGFLSGLLNDEEELLGIGRIRDIDDDRVLVETQTKERPAFLEIGNLLLSSRYEEVGYGSLH